MLAWRYPCCGMLPSTTLQAQDQLTCCRGAGGPGRASSSGVGHAGDTIAGHEVLVERLWARAHSRQGRERF